MTKKHLAFIIILSLAAMLIWIVGEVVIVAVFKFGNKASIFWTIFMILATLGISVWKGMKDENDKNNRNW